MRPGTSLLLLLVCLHATSAFVRGLDVTAGTTANSAGEMLVNLTVPDFQITKDDMYVCTTVALPAEPMKLVGVVPQADMAVVHHILLYGCKTPYKMPDAQHPSTVWECMGLPMCSDGGGDILYGWGRNAPRLQLPDGVGFTVGPGSGIRYVVAQVHYLSSKRPTNDHSGVALVLRPQPVPYAAGIIAFATGFTIPGSTPSYLVDNECCYRGHQPLTTFAVRAHTHALGRSVYMTRPTWNHSGTEEMTRIDPQLPQAFYPVQRHTVWPGDRLKVTCDFNSATKHSSTSAGSTHNDEMCNMYMMVFGWTPFINMCGGGSFSVGVNSPGSMPSDAPFELDPSPFWAPPDPSKSPLGEMTGVAVAADSALWGLYRGDRVWDGNTFDASHHATAKEPIPQAVVVRMDPDTGKVLSAWGANTFYMPHMLTTDQQGNVWVVDTGLHQVLKYSAAGELLLTLGTKLEPGSGKDHFCKPTKVAVLRDGTIFVSDGYCNSRVVKFSADGTYLAEAEVQGGQVVHSVVADECQNRIYVASRENGVVIAYDIDTLQRVDRKENFGGRVWALFTRPQGGTLALVWNPDKVAQIVDIETKGHYWDLPGMNEEYPHEVALGPAPLALSGANERLHALYVVPTCPPPTCGKLRRYILLPDGRKLPSAAAIAAAGPQPLPSVPSLTLALPGHAAAGAVQATAEVLSQQSGQDTPAPEVSATPAQTTATNPQGQGTTSLPAPSSSVASTTATGESSSVNQAAEEEADAEEEAEQELEEEIEAEEEAEEEAEAEAEEAEAEEEEAEYMAAAAEAEAQAEGADGDSAAKPAVQTDAAAEEEAEEEAAEEEEVHKEAEEAIKAEEEDDKQKMEEGGSGTETAKSEPPADGVQEEEDEGAVLVNVKGKGSTAEGPGDGDAGVDGDLEEELAQEEELEAEEAEEEAFEEEDEDAGYEEDLGEGEGDGKAGSAGPTDSASKSAAPDAASKSGAPADDQSVKGATAGTDSVLDVQEEQAASTAQIVVLLVFAAVMLSLVVTLALFVLRKVVSGDSRAAGPGYAKTGMQEASRSIEDMLRDSKHLDDIEAVPVSSNGNGRRQKDEEERRGLMSGLVNNSSKAAHKGRASK